MVGPAVAHPSTCGPIRIPRLISITTKGRRIRGIHSDKSGANTAMVRISIRECNSCNVMNQTEELADGSIPLARAGKANAALERLAYAT
jgi:hypothetical protein